MYFKSLHIIQILIFLCVVGTSMHIYASKFALATFCPLHIEVGNNLVISWTQPVTNCFNYYDCVASKELFDCHSISKWRHLHKENLATWISAILQQQKLPLVLASVANNLGFSGDTRACSCHYQLPRWLVCFHTGSYAIHLVLTLANS